MILGIDVGGTHTDAVLVNDGQLVAKTKVLTDPLDIMASLWSATRVLLDGREPCDLERVVLSTTISTNAIVQKKTSRVAMILLSGPGLAPSMLNTGADTFFARGYVNHRGIEVESVSSQEIGNISNEINEKAIRQVGIVGKFSTRNPSQEIETARQLQSDGRHISMGHTLSGHLNFPRRIATTYLNAAIYEIYTQFAGNARKFIDALGIEVPVYVLKADGGTILLDASLECPVQTIHSGPAAGIMGVMVLADMHQDAVALDIGGTTTDISVFADGVPLLEPTGVTIDGRKTLIRGLYSKSIGVGGDSVVRAHNKALTIGPDREGPAAGLGGSQLTPTDAMIALDIVDFGDKEKALAALRPLARALSTDPLDVARAIIHETTEVMKNEILHILEEINNKPVYTIHELLEGKRVEPKMLYVVGGPAALAPYISEKLGIPYCIPPNADVANALGVALARTTAEITILADTEKGEMIISEEGRVVSIPDDFTMDDAIAAGREALIQKARQMGADPRDMLMEVSEAQEFNMIRDFYTTGKNIRVKVQIKPGLISAGTPR